MMWFLYMLPEEKVNHVYIGGLGRHIGRYICRRLSTDYRSTIGRQSTDIVLNHRYSTDTWPILDRYMTDTWPIHDRYLTDTWPTLTDTWPTLDRYLTDTRPIRDRYMADTWPILDRYTTDMWPIHDRYMTDTWPILHWYLADDSFPPTGGRVYSTIKDIKLQ